jgi:quercetin dioxygenase-like cupin family protein
MRKLLGLMSLCALVGAAAGAHGAGATPPSGQFASVEHGRAQQAADGTVVAAAGQDVGSATYTVAPGGDSGWRTGPGTTTVAVTKGALKVVQADCASQDVAAGNAVVLAAGQFRLQNAGQEPAELLANFTALSAGGGTPLVDGPPEAAPACAGEAAEPQGVTVGKYFRGDVSPYFRQVHAGHGGAEGATKDLKVEAGKDAFMGTYTLQPGFSTGWFTHTPHIAIITKGSWAFYGERDGKCQIVEEYQAGEAWPHDVHRHLGAVQGNEPVELTLFGYNMKHGDPMPLLDSNPDHLDFMHAPPASCPTQLR